MGIPWGMKEMVHVDNFLSHRKEFTCEEKNAFIKFMIKHNGDAAYTFLYKIKDELDQEQRDLAYAKMLTKPDLWVKYYRNHAKGEEKEELLSKILESPENSAYYFNNYKCTNKLMNQLFSSFIKDVNCAASCIIRYSMKNILNQERYDQIVDLIIESPNKVEDLEDFFYYFNNYTLTTDREHKLIEIMLKDEDLYESFFQTCKRNNGSYSYGSYKLSQQSREFIVHKIIETNDIKVCKSFNDTFDFTDEEKEKLSHILIACKLTAN